MKKAIFIVFVLAMALFLTGAIVVVDACDGVPSMSREDACREAFGTAPMGQQEDACTTACIPPMYEFCLTVLYSAPDASEVTVFAVVAAKYAKLSYESTMEAAYRMLQNATLPGDERAAYAACRDSYYPEARSVTVGALTDMEGCSFGQLRREYAAAADAIRACGDEVSKLQTSAMFGLTVADLRVAALASGVGELVFAKQ
ncbi:hypothetical protein E2562_038321 [Oryza meyeriana var. granulata]|uniref:Pectinesterase inhibitor domain-containing protein n=1 Tax=Oryza meyeriana var. granulata TaxID=110450 RepID=A0A6G1CL69_9ORYZ|nr:hypothetical protein E2562_038321 [Oryza meyeriana var. granulata]